MMKVLGRFEPYIFALLRIVTGLLFVMHGSQKLLGIPGDKPPVAIASLAGAAGVIELLGGLMIMVGLFAGIAAFIASGEMAVAYFMAHASQDPLPINNHGEPAVLFCFLLLYIAAHGSGIWSMDAIIAKSRRSPGS